MKLGKVLLINMCILAIYFLVVVFTPEPTNDMPGLARMIILMFILGIHAIALFIISMVLFYKKRTPLAKAFLLATFVVLVIGGAWCFGFGF